MNEHEWLAERFEAHRTRLRAVAYQMLGSLSEADDAVQEAWLRLSGTDPGSIENMGGWLTTVIARVCLDMLRTRKSRREEPLEAHLPEPIVSLEGGTDPEYEALLADSVGLGLLVVLETLAPAERLAFVLHDMFGLSFNEIAPIVRRSPNAARQLASRARRRIQVKAKFPDADLANHRHVVDAFLAAARSGDFDALVAVLDPEVVVRADTGPLAPGVPREVRGARAVAAEAHRFAQRAWSVQHARVNGAAGLVASTRGRVISLLGFTIMRGKIVEINILADPARLRLLDLAGLSD